MLLSIVVWTSTNPKRKESKPSNFSLIARCSNFWFLVRYQKGTHEEILKTGRVLCCFRKKTKRAHVDSKNGITAKNVKTDRVLCFSYK